MSTGLGDPPSYVTHDVFQLPTGRFIVVSDVPRNWTASVAFCASRGMRIASIHNQAEADSLEWLIKRATYLGATYSSADGWQWEDGVPWLEFTHKRTQFGQVDEGQHLVTWPDMGWTNTGTEYFHTVRKDGSEETFTGQTEPELSVACTAGSPAYHAFCEEMRGSEGGRAWVAASTHACAGE